VIRDPALATWLVVHRGEIERRLAPRLGGTLPGSASAEAEALRRFRSFAASALRMGALAAPALDGLRVEPAVVGRLLDSWVETAAELAGERGETLATTLSPLARSFTAALRGTSAARRASGEPRPASRRAVAAAIDRVADAFLAVDVDTGRIADANPAAGALLGVARDGLLEREAEAFVVPARRGAWSTHIDAMSEGAEPRRFRTELQVAGGSRVEVEASVTRFATRKRTLALVVARPLSG
jgi:PAS domain S-box-containing protein